MLEDDALFNLTVYETKQINCCMETRGSRQKDQCAESRSGY